MTGTQKFVLWLLGLIIVAGGLFLFLYPAKETPPVSVNSFEECAEHYPVLESYPAQCNTPEGKNFVEDIGNELEKQDKIVIDDPRPIETVVSPLHIAGSARGNWYFEASFPIELQDGNGVVIATGHAEAQSEWMTTNFVPYKATISFTKPATPKGTLILRKDNPSGLPEHDDALIVPVKF